MFRNNDNIADNNTTTKSTLCKKDVIFKNLDKTLHISIIWKNNEIGNDAGINHT